MIDVAPNLLALAMPLLMLLAIGGLAGVAIIIWSYAHWRAAVKVAFVAVILEGAIRKWVFPQGQELVYFLKDVFLVGAYIRFYLMPDAELRAYRLRVPGLLISILAALVCLSALNPNLGSPFLSMYGVKIYFMYLPLTFMMPYLFRTQGEMVRQLTWYALLAIPVCLLGLLQWQSDRFSLINTFSQGMGEGGATTFGFGERARITGTFSYLTGHTTFVVFFGTLHLALLSLKETPRKWLLLGISFPLLVGNALMGGARSSIITLGFVTLGFVFANLTGKVGTSRNFMVILTGAIIAVVGAVALAFTNAWSDWSTRYQTAGDTFKGRVVEHPLGSLKMAFRDSGVTGFGMGASHPASEALRQRLNLPAMGSKTPVYDAEPGQILVELGFVGFLSWYTLRLLLIWLAWNSFRRASPGISRALCLSAVLLAIPHLLMSVVFNHTASFLIFALTGLSLLPLLESTQFRRYRRAHQQGTKAEDPSAEVPAYQHESLAPEAKKLANPAPGLPDPSDRDSDASQL